MVQKNTENEESGGRGWRSMEHQAEPEGWVNRRSQRRLRRTHLKLGSVVSQRLGGETFKRFVVEIPQGTLSN